MFDIGFMELLLIGIVALLVLGPDKLPGAIRTGALWFGRAKRSFNSVKAEIEQQINADEIRRQLHNESILGDIEKAKKNANKLIEDTQSEIRSAEDSVKRSVNPNSKPNNESNTQPSSKPGTATKATTSADEGIPTPPPENYRVPDEANPATSAEPATGHTAASGDNTEETAATSVETTSQTGTASEAEPAPGTASTQDIYSTPPSGIVSLQKGKFSAVDNKPKDSDSSSGNK